MWVFLAYGHVCDLVGALDKIMESYNIPSDAIDRENQKSISI